jgi:hypothetical protein
MGAAGRSTYGALYYRVLVSGAPLRPRYADALLDQFYDAIAVH